MALIFNFVDHLLPLVITGAFLITVVSMVIGVPYCRYVHAVARADTREGKEELARYLASQAGGRKIDVTHSWQSFMPAAKRIHEDHLERRRSQERFSVLTQRQSWKCARQDGGTTI